MLYLVLKIMIHVISVSNHRILFVSYVDLQNELNISSQKWLIFTLYVCHWKRRPLIVAFSIRMACNAQHVPRNYYYFKGVLGWNLISNHHHTLIYNSIWIFRFEIWSSATPSFLSHNFHWYDVLKFNVKNHKFQMLSKINRF